MKCLSLKKNFFCSRIKFNSSTDKKQECYRELRRESHYVRKSKNVIKTHYMNRKISWYSRIYFTGGGPRSNSLCGYWFKKSFCLIIADQNCVLVHGDMWSPQFLWRGGKLAAIVDWQLAHAGNFVRVLDNQTHEHWLCFSELQ